MDGTLLFIDPVCPRSYDPSNINVPGGVGGTEQTMVCLAEGLGKAGWKIVVEQHNKESEYVGNALYTAQGKTQSARWVVVLRDPRAMLDARKRFPNAKIYLWSHDLADRNLGLCYSAGIFKDSRCTYNICVSEWHRTQTNTVLKSVGYSGEFKLRFVYNPLSEDVIRTGEPYDKNKLIWLASPHKGIAKAYEIFKRLIALNPDFRLYVSNPGYMENQYTDDSAIKDKVVVLGTLPHEEAVRHLRSSLCLFYPNTVFPETFGKILAEANAVGTPVLSSPLGATREVLDSHPDQIADCRDTEIVVKRIMKWWEGARPIVRGNPRFKLANVINEWRRLLLDVR